LAANGEPWTTWLILGGRGAGKTRSRAEWVRSVALADGKARKLRRFGHRAFGNGKSLPLNLTWSA
jgi:phage terminase large subunit-like protein